MIKVLQVFGEPLSNGGQESFVMNIYRNIDRKKIQFDLYTPFFCDNQELKDEVKFLGGDVFSSNGKFDGEANKSDFIKKLSEFLKINRYDVIHIHSGSIFNLSTGAKIAKKYGAKKVIVHSHATGIDNLKYRVVKLLSKPLFLKYVDIYLACSLDAAKWKFPKKIIRSNQFKIIKNGIDLQKFEFNKKIRTNYRNKLKIKDDEFVIGHIGRMDINKNHFFLLKVFLEYLKYNSNSKLLMIGTGRLKNDIIEQIQLNNLEDRIILLGNRTDVHNLLQSMDMFVFPSKFEGLGMVVIEAQAAGLITLCSESIPEEARITELFKPLKLGLGPEVWAREVHRYERYERKKHTEVIKESGYDALDVALTLQDLYIG